MYKKILNNCYFLLALSLWTGCASLNDLHFHDEANAKKAKNAFELFEKVDFETTIKNGRANTDALNKSTEEAIQDQNKISLQLYLSDIIGTKPKKKKGTGWKLLESKIDHIPFLDKQFSDLKTDDLQDDYKTLIDLKNISSKLILKEAILNIKQNRDELNRATKRYNRRLKVYRRRSGSIDIPDTPREFPDPNSEDFKFSIENSKDNDNLKDIYQKLAEYAKDIRKFEDRIELGEKLPWALYIEKDFNEKDLLRNIHKLEKNIKNQKKDIEELLIPFKEAQKKLAETVKIISEAEKRTDSELAATYKKQLNEKTAVAEVALKKAEKELESAKKDDQTKADTEKLTKDKDNATQGLSEANADLKSIEGKKDSEIAKLVLNELESSIKEKEKVVTEAEKKLEKAENASPRDESIINTRKEELNLAKQELETTKGKLTDVITVSNKEVAERYLKPLRDKSNEYQEKIKYILDLSKNLPLIGNEIKSELIADMLTKYENLLNDGDSTEISMAKEILGILGRDPEVAYRLGLRRQRVPSLNALILELAIHRLRYQYAISQFDFDKLKLKLLREKKATYDNELIACIKVGNAVDELGKDERKKLTNNSLDVYFKKASPEHKKLVIKALTAFGTAQAYGINSRLLIDDKLTALERNTNLKDSQLALTTWKDYIGAPLKEIKAYHEGGITYDDVAKTMYAVGLGVIAGGVYK